MRKNQQADECFLCEPDTSLVYLKEGPFFAMLGLGPIGTGYSVIATAAHVASMFDLDAEEGRLLTQFTARVRNLLSPHFGPCSLAEHGRIALCVSIATKAHEPHCLHAHRLVFPSLPNLPLRLAVPDLPVETFESFDDARMRQAFPERQYLYTEDADGSCEVCFPSRPIARQLLRQLAVALRKEARDVADWRTFPNHATIETAQKALGLR